MDTLEALFANNREWAERISSEQPGFFEQMERGQSPDYLWIGCSDSRVPANEILNLPPGGIFVHRNIANLVVNSDLNCLSVIQYAVEVLKVKHIIVCGHYGCGGVSAAMEPAGESLIEKWLQNIRDVYHDHSEQLDSIDDPEKRKARLCELNVIEQVTHVCNTPMVANAWKAGQELYVHGWIYHLVDGLLQDLNVSVNGPKK